jgi:hypothetical protein
MELDLSNLNLEILPYIPEGITILKCNNNRLKSIEMLPLSLEELHCENNNLTYLFNLPKNLKILKCKGNQIRVIELHESFYKDNKELSGLEYDKFSMRWNPIKPGNKIYGSLYSRDHMVSVFKYNDSDYENYKITSILNLSNLNIKILPLIPEGVEMLICDDNDISEIKNLPNSLKILRCYNNNTFLKIFAKNNIKILNNSEYLKIIKDF